MTIYINPSKADLANYVNSQIKSFFPTGNDQNLSLIAKNLDEAILRTQRCINGVKPWKIDEFNILHSSQYCIFLWYLSNTIWKAERDEAICTKIFYLNKTLNGFECFYDNNLPEIFFIGHTVGIVLVRNNYPNYLVLYQGVTVGKSIDSTPIIEEKVIFYPHSSVNGNSTIRSGSVLSKGVDIINKSTPGNSIVFQDGKDLIFKQQDESIFKNYFRL